MLCGGDAAESTFRVHIIAPGAEPFDLQVSPSFLSRFFHVNPPLLALLQIYEVFIP